MMFLKITQWFFLFSYLSNVSVCGQREGDDLVQTRSVSSKGGLLDISLTIEYADYNGAAHRFTNARLLNGTLPGPTLRLKAGDKMRILFHNKLEDQDIPTPDDEEYKYPDHANLHFHGAHVTGELPSDDIRINIAPGDSFQYEADFPTNHMPGTHWMHPHVHGSSALQVGTGAALAWIVEDPPNYLSRQVEKAKEVLMMIQYMNLNTLDDIIDDINDDKMRIRRPGTDSNVGQSDYRMVNGQFRPTLDMRPGEWQRWRIVYGSWLRDPLNLDIIAGNRCEMQLLAKDGIYIRDFPREITMAPIPTGGRADIMVRCTEAGDYTVVDFDNEVFLNLRVSGNPVNSEDLAPWSPPTLPPYLEDLRFTTVKNDCKCQTRLHGGNSCPGRFCVNEEPFNPERYVHTIKFGDVIERELRGAGAHPYHQHVYPFQIVDNVDNDPEITDQQKAYFKEGDWHDVIMIDDLDENLIMRYRADIYDGRIMLHCHRLNHEDRGMMSQEHIVMDGKCECDAQSVSLPVDPSSEASRNPPPNLGGGGASAPPPAFCVSGAMTMDVQGKGPAVAIENVEIGDFIRSDKLEYSRVYSFGHYDKDQTASYLQIQLEGMMDHHQSPLEISSTHMVFLENNIAVPASDVKVGDYLMTTMTTARRVHSIESIIRRGAYAPFTYSGTAVINGVVVSNYVTMNELNLSHWMAHAFLAPRRLYCQMFWNHCQKETYSQDDQGIANWVISPWRLGESLSSSLMMMKMKEYSSIMILLKVVLSSLLVFVAAMMYGLDSIFTTPYCVLILFPLTLMVMLTRKQKTL